MLSWEDNKHGDGTFIYTVHSYSRNKLCKMSLWNCIVFGLLRVMNAFVFFILVTAEALNIHLVIIFQQNSCKSCLWIMSDLPLQWACEKPKSCVYNHCKFSGFHDDDCSEEHVASIFKFQTFGSKLMQKWLNHWPLFSVLEPWMQIYSLLWVQLL